MAANPGNTALRLRGVTKHYRLGLRARRVEVLSGLDLELARGERLGLVGPNGHGKSTCLRIAAGAELQSGGEVSVLGQPPRSLAARRRTGFVPDGSPFPPELSAPACLELVAGVQGLFGRAARHACGEMLERVGLGGGHRNDRGSGASRGRLATFSQGMLRRFALAQAFVTKPDLVLLDEPTSGLDAEGHGVLDQLLAEARERDAAVLLCSHHLDEVLRWTDGLAVLAGGVLHPDAELRAEGAEGTECNRVRLEVAGLDAGSLDELEHWIAERGGRVTERSPTAGALLALYAELGSRGREDAR